MSPDLLLSIDQGTTNTKGSLIGRDGRVAFRAAKSVALSVPKAGFVEQNALEIWHTTRDVLRECAQFAASAGLSIAGLAISNQRETAVAWRRPRRGRAVEPLGPAISWQCRRSSSICAELSPHQARIRSISGLPLDPLVSGGKWAWMLQNLPDVEAAAAEGSLCLGNVDSWLLACLTENDAHLTDRSNASRTGLMSLETLRWSEDLLSIFGVDEAFLPELRPSSFPFGTCVSVPELEGVPIVSMIGDSHAAMVGHGSYTPGSTKATYGTGSSLMTLTGTARPKPTPTLARTVAWSIGDSTQFAVEGNIAMTGSAVQWVGEFLGLNDAIDDAIALSASVPDAAGMAFVPAMVGLGAPYWDSAARGTITGLERSHTKAHLARAAIESIAHQIGDVFEAMEQSTGQGLPALRTDGGPTRNDALMQLQSDLLGRRVLRPANEELSALGAAALGGVTLGWWSSLEDFATRLPDPTVFEPGIPAEHRAKLRAAWADAVSRTLSSGARDPG